MYPGSPGCPAIVLVIQFVPTKEILRTESLNVSTTYKFVALSTATSDGQ